VRLVADGSLNEAQEQELARLVQRKLGHPFAIRFAYFPDRLPTGPGGKFEEFVCKI
jgi:phenylacetate-CoA ligase